MTVAWIAGIGVWVFCGWLAGRRFLRSLPEPHDNADRVIGLVFIGPGLVGLGLLLLIDPPERLANGFFARVLERLYP